MKSIKRSSKMNRLQHQGINQELILIAILLIREMIQQKNRASANH